MDEYADARIYEAEYGQYQGDFPFFLNAVENGSVLDLACGTGRLTIPFARKRFVVTGLDNNAPMLNLAREKVQNLPISWTEGDMSHFSLNQKFDVITLAGNAFQALLTEKDQMRMLKCVLNHLNPGGVFAFSTRNSLLENLISSDVFHYWHDFMDMDGVKVRVEGKQSYDEKTQIMTYTTKRIWPDHETISVIELRFTNFEALQNLLSEVGLSIIETYGDGNNGPYKKTSPSIFLKCRAL